VAASFRILKAAREWFRDLRGKEGSFRTDFDAFYFCFIAGIAANRKMSVKNDDTAELVDYFPERYGPRRELLVALFITRELQNLGISLEEKDAMNKAISTLVNPHSPSFLSDDGVREFNKYAHGGFEVLQEWFDDRPRTLPVFLRAFKNKLDAHVAATAAGGAFLSG